MSDYDRGAYTPQTDAPLAFDPRRPSERRPMPMALIGSAAVLVILLAGVAMVYRGGVRHAGESPRPVGEPVMAVKTAPAATPAAAPASNMDVYSPAQNTTGSGAAPAQTTTANAAAAPPAAGQTTSTSTTSTTTVASSAPAASGSAPRFAPSAEQPAPRPAPKPSTVAMLAKPTAPNHIERPATPTEEAARTAAAEPPAKPHAAATAPHVAARARIDQDELAAAGGTRLAEAEPHAASTHRAKVAAEADDDDGVATPKAKPAPALAAASPASGKSVVQIGAFSSSTLADKGYADVSAALPGRMGGKSKHVQPLDKDGTTLYRTWLSGFASRSDAVAFCEALKAKGRTCLVKG